MSKFEAKRTTVSRLYETEGFELDTHVRLGTNRYGDFIVAVTDHNTKRTCMVNFGNKVRFMEHITAGGPESDYYTQEAIVTIAEGVVDIMS